MLWETTAMIATKATKATKAAMMRGVRQDHWVVAVEAELRQFLEHESGTITTLLGAFCMDKRSLNRFISVGILF
jgi:hypothetical protein